MAKNVKSIIEHWLQFDIKSIQHELDDKVIEIAQQLEEGDTSRKKLIEQTKEFRKNLNDEQKKLIGPILKQFQVEVDSSSKRSKLMEQVLLKLYKQLIDLPDPNPALENAERVNKKAEKMQDLEIENKQLKNTLEEYHLEFVEVKNQEVTIKNLNQKIKELEEKADSQVQQRLKEKEKELQLFHADKEQKMQETQLDLVKKLGDTENKYLTLKAQTDRSQNEIYELKQKHDEVLSAKSCEMDMLLQDLDKLTERAVNAERLVEQYMQASIDKPTNQANKVDEENGQLDEMKLLSYRSSSLEVELNAKEKEIAQLVEDIQKLHMKSNKSREFHESQRGQLEEQLAEREKRVQELETELNNKKDYEELKRELGVLKTIEFSFPSTMSNSNEAAMQQQPLELLLLEKNRFLQSENTQIKNKLADLNQQHDLVSKEHVEFKRVNTELKTLVVELEKDLLKLASAQNGNQHQSKDLVLELETNLAVAGPNDSIINLTENKSDLASYSSENKDVSLFNIVSNQRERFKVRCQELESENMATKQQITFLTNELDHLRSDNLKLYEKIRYLQSVNFIF